MKAQKIDLSLMPSRLMQTARQVKITNILNGSLAIVKKEESEYYRKLVLSKGKEFKILVKIDRNFPNVEPNMNVIAMEIHEVPKKMQRSNQDIAAVEARHLKAHKTNRCKRTKKIKEAIAR
ncbi:hypothetical protein H5410_025600 [Solanum commersonii]|uniref:Uncharacterized protein n=1 Tax=Solanum commersonii TaxID=4109 RepID=A0A9J5YYF1_SOLCO|nr:hypothetical protein H5410_025600 [Solanum commersonii]